MAIINQARVWLRVRRFSSLLWSLSCVFFHRSSTVTQKCEAHDIHSHVELSRSLDSRYGDSSQVCEPPCATSSSLYENNNKKFTQKLRALLFSPRGARDSPSSCASSRLTAQRERIEMDEHFALLPYWLCSWTICACLLWRFSAVNSPSDHPSPTSWFRCSIHFRWARLAAAWELAITWWHPNPTSIRSHLIRCWEPSDRW